MKIRKAIKLAKRLRLKMTRPTWDELTYLLVEDGQMEVLFADVIEEGVRLTVDDILANDWEVVSE